MFFWISFSLLLIGIISAVTVWRREIRADEASLSGKATASGRGSAHRHVGMTPMIIMVVALAASIYVLLLRTVWLSLGGVLAGFLGSLYATFQVFVAGSDMSGAVEAIKHADGFLPTVEAVYTALLYACAPLVTLGFILTLFQAFSAQTRLLLNRRSELNVFSELNERSLALAQSIRDFNHDHGIQDCVVFTNVILPQNDPSVELIGSARRLGAICFKDDIASLSLGRNSRRHIRLFIIGSDEREVLDQAIDLLDDSRVSTRENTDMFVFSDTIESRMLLSHRSSVVHVRRVNPARTLVYGWLWRDKSSPVSQSNHSPITSGDDLFDYARADHIISAAIVGLGDHGLEMLRALSWFCQMDDDDASYDLEINGFDKDPDAEGHFRLDYPELASPPASVGPVHYRQRQDATYSIRVHGSVDATSEDFVKQILNIKQLTFVFVCLGDDLLNLRVANRLRIELARSGRNPQILVVSSRPDDARLEQVISVRGPDGVAQPTLELIGSIKEQYSYSTIIQSEMEWSGLLCHMSWAGHESLEWQNAINKFWADEYSYRSSVAVPIHWNARRNLNVLGSQEPPQDRSPRQKEMLKRLEHARWNAFMRSEGFIYGPVKDLEVAKTHNLLVPFDQLEPRQQDKDDNDARDALIRLRATTDARIQSFLDQAATYVRTDYPQRKSGAPVQ